MEVKYIAEIETPTDYTGYLVDDTVSVPFDESNRNYQEVQMWIAEGNTPDPAYTQEELDEYEKQQNIAIQNSMLEEGNIVNIADSNRLEVGANPIIEDKANFNEWMKKTYDEKDVEGYNLYKPPSTERQMLSIRDEDRDNYTFTRYQDEWGWRWYLRLYRDSVNALAIAIYDENGNYLYTTGALLEHPDGGWYTECPPGQADKTQFTRAANLQEAQEIADDEWYSDDASVVAVSDIYYKWLLGSAPISNLEVYPGDVEEKSGIVRSDERYDQ